MHTAFLYLLKHFKANKLTKRKKEGSVEESLQAKRTCWLKKFVKAVKASRVSNYTLQYTINWRKHTPVIIFSVYGIFLWRNIFYAPQNNWNLAQLELRLSHYPPCWTSQHAPEEEIQMLNLQGRG